jgi:hypothetical protein
MKWKKENSIDESVSFWTLETEESIISFNYYDDEFKIEHLPFNGVPSTLMYSYEEGKIHSFGQEFSSMSEVKKKQFETLLNYHDDIKNSPIPEGFKKYYDIALKQLQFELTPKQKNVYMFVRNVFMTDSFSSTMMRMYMDYFLAGPIIEHMAHGKKYSQHLSIVGYSGNKKTLDILGPFKIVNQKKYWRFESDQLSWFVSSFDKKLEYEKWRVSNLQHFIRKKYTEDRKKTEQ